MQFERKINQDMEIIQKEARDRVTLIQRAETLLSKPGDITSTREYYDVLNEVARAMQVICSGNRPPLDAHGWQIGPQDGIQHQKALVQRVEDVANAKGAL